MKNANQKRESAADFHGGAGISTNKSHNFSIILITVILFFSAALFASTLASAQAGSSNSNINWTERLSQLQDNFDSPPEGATYGDVTAPATVTINLDIRSTDFNRLGFLFCSKPVIETNGQCPELHLGKHSVTITLTEEQIARLSQSISSEVTSSVQSEVSASISAAIPVVGAGVEVSGSLGASESQTRVSSQTIENEIRAELSQSEEITMDGHAPRCMRLEVPYGLQTVVTVTGSITVMRNFNANYDGEKWNLEWTNTYSVLASDLDVDVSVDGTIDESGVTLTPVRCDKCDENKSKTPAGDSSGKGESKSESESESRGEGDSSYYQPGESSNKTAQYILIASIIISLILFAAGFRTGNNLFYILGAGCILAGGGFYLLTPQELPTQPVQPIQPSQQEFDKLSPAKQLDLLLENADKNKNSGDIDAEKLDLMRALDISLKNNLPEKIEEIEIKLSDTSRREASENRRSGKNEDAVKSAHESLIYSPENPWAYVEGIINSEESGKHDDALGYADELDEIEPSADTIARDFPLDIQTENEYKNYVSDLNNRGTETARKAETEDDIAGAIDYINQAANYLGEALAISETLDAAGVSDTKTASIAGNLVSAGNNLIVLQMQAGRFNNAEYTADETLKTIEKYKNIISDESKSGILSNTAVVHALSGDYEKAVDFANQSISINPENAGANNVIASSLTAIGGKNNVMDALTYSQKAVDLEPGNEIYLNNLNTIQDAVANEDWYDIELNLGAFAAEKGNETQFPNDIHIGFNIKQFTAEWGDILEEYRTSLNLPSGEFKYGKNYSIGSLNPAGSIKFIKQDNGKIKMVINCNSGSSVSISFLQWTVDGAPVGPVLTSSPGFGCLGDEQKEITLTNPILNTQGGESQESGDDERGDDSTAPGGSTSSGLKNWSAEDKLEWSDFRGSRPAGNTYPENAMTHYEIVPGWWCVDGVFHFDVRVYFNQNESWVDAGMQSDDLLNHEQKHFDLAEVHARKIRKALSELEENPCEMTEAEMNQFIGEIVGNILAEEDAEQIKYDDETKHGTDQQAQEEWDTYISSELEKLKDYA